MANLKVLIIDDSTTMRAIVRVYLVGQGYDFLEAKDGASGLELAKRELPDAIVTDLRMAPVDGAELCQKIRATPALAHVAVILMTASTDPEERARASQCGCDGFLTKPIDPAALAREVTRVIEKRRTVT